MYVINDAGDAAANLDVATFFGLGNDPQTGDVVLAAQTAHGGGVFTVRLTSGGKDRAMKAAEAIAAGLKAGKRIIDLNDLLGGPPNLAIPQGRIIVPPGYDGGRS